MEKSSTGRVYLHAPVSLGAQSSCLSEGNTTLEIKLPVFRNTAQANDARLQGMTARVDMWTVRSVLFEAFGLVMDQIRMDPQQGVD